MFVVTQLIGLAVVNAYTPQVEQVVVNGTVVNQTVNPLPYGMDPPAEPSEFSLLSIVIAFVIAVSFIFLLTKLKAAIFIKMWFFVVVIIVLGITMNALFMNIDVPYASWIAVAVALPLAIYKVFKRNIIVHNLTELMIYPGIAVVFIPLLNIWTAIILLILISIYDMWAVWHSGFMQKMAHFQINELKVFGGFFVPYLNKKQRVELKAAKAAAKKSKSKKGKEMKVNLAILGGGDVVFPIITAGVVLRSIGLWPALIVSTCATLALLGLFFMAQKGKFYPAMPFITGGLLVGIGIAYLI